MLFLVACCFCTIAGAQVKTSSISPEELYRKSDAVIVGSVISRSPVVNSTKLLTPSPRSQDYDLGVEFILEAEEWLKGTSSSKKLRTVKILRTGKLDDHGVWLQKGHRYLLFLKKNSLDQSTFADALVVKTTKDIHAPENQFRIDEYFEVVSGQRGIVFTAKEIARTKGLIKRQ